MFYSDCSFIPCFDHETWGSISDILNTVVGAVSIILIFLTFRSQEKFNKKQLEINENQDRLNQFLLKEQELSIRPFFKILSAKQFPAARRGPGMFNINIKLTNAEAFNVSVYNTKSDGGLDGDAEIKYSYAQLTVENDFLLSPSLSDYSTKYFYLLKFCDIMGIEYQQHVRFINGTFEITYPVKVEKST